ncbi:LCP family protein [Clostridium formicaceticum]|uniref:Transcriptional regulator n=1 Tax=Clostridium formicaceticum TaxID=1497 RepID=A0AAC9RI61_9CLOT|nr:LCP family protein [Clostridium formicaceticum]AOY75499.1 transcriptional regulator [Clostridium formicaceticum]ARE85788.1 Putative transcriptional regulator YvhJ [Clostridium formicaceticum]
MKIFLKIFTLAFTSFVLLFSGAFLSFNTFMRDKHPSAEVPVIVRPDDEHFEETEPEIKDELLKAVSESKRINFIMLGLEGMRSDTMMFVSFDPENKDLDVISIPRDTYYPRVGYNSAAKKKINAAYGDHGAAGVKTVVSDLLFDIPVHHYITIDYKGVAAIVDAIGGVPVTIPKGGMHYRDDYDKPPLVINFPAGPRVLNGEDAVKFLRYRKPTPGSGAADRDGDLGRIEAQQEFMQSALKKAMSLGSLPNLVSSSFKHVRTDIALQDVVRYASNAVGLSMENISMNMLPGIARYQGGVSYYFHDQKETRQLLLDIYGVTQKELDTIEEE